MKTFEKVAYAVIGLIITIMIGVVVYMSVIYTPPVNPTRTELSSGLIRYEDPEAQVVCYLYNTFTMSCVPISETQLEP